MTPAPAPPAAGAGALDRGLAILSHVARVRSCTASEVAAALGLTRSTAYRLIDRLRDQDWLATEPASGRLSLGPAAAALATAAVGTTPLKDVAVPALHELLLTTRETVSLAVPHDNVMVFIHREQGPHPVAVSGRLGSTRPLHSTSVGRAYLAALPVEECEEIIRELIDSPLSELTAVTAEHLRKEVSLTRERGWSQDQREFDRSSACCGAAILDSDGRPVASISVAGVAERMEGLLSEIGPLVKRTAEAITLTSGGRVTPLAH